MNFYSVINSEMFNDSKVTEIQERDYKEGDSE
jgi:hypothetical protein